MGVEPSVETIAEFVKEAREAWAEDLKASGESQNLYMITKPALRFLAEYQNIKEQLEDKGFEVPNLIDGMKVTFTDD